MQENTFQDLFGNKLDLTLSEKPSKEARRLFKAFEQGKATLVRVQPKDKHTHKEVEQKMMLLLCRRFNFNPYKMHLHEGDTVFVIFYKNSISEHRKLQIKDYIEKVEGLIIQEFEAHEAEKAKKELEKEGLVEA